MIPDFQTLMLPILEILKDEKEYQKKDIVDSICNKFNLTKEERNERFPKGKQYIIWMRVHWSMIYLNKADLAQKIDKSTYKITSKGISELLKNHKKLDVNYLRSIADFSDWLPNKLSEVKNINENILTNETPEELIEFSYHKIKEELVLELIEKIKTCSPRFFEQLVIDLLIAMGYGGSRIDAGQVVGKSGDGGIDGIIKEDKLGLDNIYIQAKRWEGQVTISTVRDFAGSLLAKKAKKGIFITTSTFPKSAYEFISSIEPRIILIDGKELAEMMIDYNVGVSIKTNYEIKKIDNDYFEDE